jgi:mannan endo-1,4-beta-mannosidase
LADCGLLNLRICAASEATTIGNAVSPTFQISPGNYNQSLLDGLDYLLAEMAKRKMKAVLFLNNFWEWSGGMLQYLAWAQNQSVYDPSLRNRPFAEWIEQTTAFYGNKPANMLYQSHIEQIILRHNNYTSISYHNDPTIMAWQIANEPRAGQHPLSSAAAQLFTDWVAHTAAIIKNLAPLQLVSIGSEGLRGCAEDLELFKVLHALPSIDYCTVHIWPKNWRWIEADQPEESAIAACQKACTYLEPHIAVSQSLQKPLILEEFGYPRDGFQLASGTPCSGRNAFFSGLLKWMQLKGNPDKLGWNVWSWGGEGSSGQAIQSCQFLDSSGLCGDPPQEPSGLNSMYSNDFETITLLKQFISNFVDSPT